MDCFGASDIRCEPVGHELGDERPGDDDALVDVKAKIAEPCFAGQVSRGNAFIDATSEQRCELGALVGGQTGVQKRIETVQRE